MLLVGVCASCIFCSSRSFWDCSLRAEQSSMTTKPKLRHVCSSSGTFDKVLSELDYSLLTLVQNDHSMTIHDKKPKMQKGLFYNEEWSKQSEKKKGKKKLILVYAIDAVHTLVIIVSEVTMSTRFYCSHQNQNEDIEAYPCWLRLTSLLNNSVQNTKLQLLLSPGSKFNM